jgi:protoheme ferro-lyase
VDQHTLFTWGLRIVKILTWGVIAILSPALGVLFVNYLSVHPLQMSLFLFATTLVLVAIVLLVVLGLEGWSRWIAIPVVLLLFLVGHLAMTRIILARDDPRFVPELTRKKGDPGLGHTAVVYFTHGEPETYDPIGWINQFNEFDEQKIPFVPLVARPFFFQQLRRHYLTVGKSDHRKMHIQMVRSLEEAYRAEGDTTTRFYYSFLDDEPRPDAALIQALNDGASRIVVSEVFLTISNHTAEGEHQIEEVRAEELGVEVKFTGPLYDSQMLQSMFVQRANAHLDGVDKSKVGILLVGHGQPDEWEEEWPTETDQEIGFRLDVLKALEADGFRAENLSLAWMEFKEPEPAEKVEEFVQNGVERVLYFAAAISADAIHSQYDIPALVNKARVPNDIPLVNLGAWNDDPIVIQAIKAKIDEQMN